MGLFDKKENDNAATLNRDQRAAITNEVTAPNTSGEDKETKVREMSGFGSLSEVADAARSMVRDGVKKAGERRGRIGNLSKSEREALEAAEKEKQAAEKRQKAMDTIGKYYSRKLADIPYEVWAKMADDPELKLTPDESKELAEAYYMTVQAFDVDFSGPWMALGGLLLLNGAMVAKRVSKIEIKEPPKEQVM